MAISPSEPHKSLRRICVTDGRALSHILAAYCNSVEASAQIFMILPDADYGEDAAQESKDMKLVIDILKRRSGPKVGLSSI